MTDFSDKVTLVTGAGRGIGRHIAEAFASQGAVVAANDITPINLDETVQRITSAGGRARAYIFDVAKRMPVQAMVDQVLEDWGRIDILVNNAGVEPHASILDMDEWDWHRTLDVNLSGPFFAMQHVGRAMRQRGTRTCSTNERTVGSGKGATQRSTSPSPKVGLPRTGRRSRSRMLYPTYHQGFTEPSSFRRA